MANNIPITTGTGQASVATETVGGVSYQQIEVYGGGGASVLSINPDGSLKASIIGTLTINSPSIYGNISGSVAAIQSGAWSTSVVGGPVTLYAPTASFVSGVTSLITGTAVTSVIAAAPGGQRNYITHILVTNQQTSVTGLGAQVNIIDDGSGNVLYSGFAAAGGGGFSITMPTPLRQPTSTFSISAKSLTQASVIVAGSGFTAS